MFKKTDDLVRVGVPYKRWIVVILVTHIKISIRCLVENKSFPQMDFTMRVSASSVLSRQKQTPMTHFSPDKIRSGRRQLMYKSGFSQWESNEGQRKNVFRVAQR